MERFPGRNRLSLFEEHKRSSVAGHVFQTGGAGGMFVSCDNNFVGHCIGELQVFRISIL